MSSFSKINFSLILFGVLTLIPKYSFSQSCFPVDFDFDININDECRVDFTQTLPSNPDSWLWHFGDGSVSYEENPSHSYNEAGCFTVTLTVEDNGNEASISKQVCVFSCNGDYYGENGDFTVIIDGPTSLGINIDYTYSANIYGADPPYSYIWDFGSAGDANWSGPHTISYNSSGNEDIQVTVTDANGNTGSDKLEVEISEIAQFVDIAFGTARVGFPTAIIGEYDLLAFEEPLTFTFGFGDGSPDETGIVSSKFHNYLNQGDYNVSFTLCEETGNCLTVVKTLHVDEDGWQSNNIPYCLELFTDTYTNSTCDCNPVLHEYEPNIIQPGGTVSVNMHGICKTCAGILQDCTTPFMPLSPPHLLNVWITFTNQHNGSTRTLPNAPLATWFPFNNPFNFTFEDWGCWDVSMQSIDGAGKTDNKYFDCVVYVEPNPLVATDISINELNSCQYYLESHAQAGARSSGEQNTFGPCIGEEYYYDVYNWEIFSIYDPLTPLQDFLIINGESKNCVEINTNHEYFRNFQQSNTVTFIAKVTITDLIGQTSSKSKIIEMPLPLIFIGDDVLNRCPGTSSTFNLGNQLAVSANNPLSYLWSTTNGFLPQYSNISANPEFNSPNHGQTVIYGLQISDNEGCVINKNISVTGANLIADAGPVIIKACSVPQSIQFLGARLPNFSGQGGSGNYIYEWHSPSPNLSYISDPYSPNPTVYNPNTIGTSITYTLEVTDLAGGCSATDQALVYATPVTDIFTHAGTSQPWSSCYGSEIELGSSSNYSLNQFDLIINWTSNNPQFNINNIEIDPIGPEGLATLNFNESVNPFLTKQAGTYTYTIQIADASNGCYEEHETTLTVIPNWLYTGFESELVPINNSAEPQSAWNGQDLWSLEGINQIITSSENPLSGATPPFDWTMIESIDILQPNYHPTNQYLENAQVDVSDFTGYGKMRVVDANGCRKDYITNRFIHYESVDVAITPLQESLVCIGEEVCFDVYFTIPVLGQNPQLPPQINTFYKYKQYVPLIPPLPGNYDLISSGNFEMNLINSSPAIYYGQVCFTTEWSGSGGNAWAVQLLELDKNNLPFGLPSNIFERSSWFTVSYIANVQEEATICDHVVGDQSPVELKIAGELTLGGCTEGFIVPDNSNNNGVLIRGYFYGATAEGRVKLLPGFHAERGSYALIANNDCVTLEDSPIPSTNPVIATRADSIISSSLNVSIYPNPFSSFITIELQSSLEFPSLIELISSRGELLKYLISGQDFTPYQDGLELNLSDISDGIYFLRFQTEYETKSYKIAKISSNNFIKK